MRRLLLVGVLLAIAAAAAIVASAILDLELESVALLGAAMGAVIALVPDRTLLARVAGFGSGFVIAWIGYVVRAAWLPDTSSGRAVAAAIVVFACVAVSAATLERIPLWAPLLGAGAFAGAYEFTYNVAPPELADTSVSTATTMLFNVGVGLLAGVLAGPGSAGALAGNGRPGRRTTTETTTFDEILEHSK
ncbi:MAG TPA: hypothetical protein VFK41_08675 [Nocardioidaceae bacterium]|nr:hypothetical protein [Nocardioidaceae bacterium]